MPGEAKAKAVTPEDGATISAEYPTEGLPTPEAVNFTAIDRLGSEVQLSVGHIDLHRAVAIAGELKKAGAGAAVLPVSITHRLVFSPEGFSRLRAQVEQIAAAIEADVTGEHPVRKKET